MLRDDRLRPAGEREEGGEVTDRGPQGRTQTKTPSLTGATQDTWVGSHIDPATQGPGVSKQIHGLLGSYTDPSGVSQRGHKQGIPP